MIYACRRFVENPVFQKGILVIIVGNAILIGIETNAELMARHATFFGILNTAVQAVFLLEIVIRVLAHAPRVWSFFRDGWNVFDFLIVGLSLLPAAGSFATVARLARLLRALRVVSAIPELRLIVNTLLRSIPSLANVLLLLGLMLYVYAVLGVHLFGRIDPEHWRSLGRAGLTLFQILTLEGWVEVQAAVLTTNPWAWMYFVSFVVFAVFVVVNLFIAIVINNLESVKNEVRVEVHTDANSIMNRLTEIRTRLTEIEHSLRSQRLGDC
ncbi:MAG: ion transporter [Candidatus Hydrogenedentes bacterium]|nr:ion transporter [Candidatus Hydrogenedentota bacterium]